MKKAICNFWVVAVVSLMFASCQKESAGSYGEMERFRDDRVYLLAAYELFWMTLPYQEATAAERLTPAFQHFEVVIHLHLLRVLYGLEKGGPLQEQTRSILKQTVRDWIKVFEKHPTTLRLWTEAGKTCDLGKSEPVLPRHYPAFDKLTEVIPSASFKIEKAMPIQQ